MPTQSATRAAAAILPEPSHAVLAQAAEWYACLRDGKASATDRAAWRAWVDANDEHGRAWRHVEEISRTFEPVRAMSDARGAADQLNAVHDRLHTRRRVLTRLSLLAGASVLGWQSWRRAWLPDELMAMGADHHTGTGEQRQITLADGSALWLNTASAIDVRFSAGERRIVLITGEIFVDTAKDAARPFLVETPHGRLRALGTRFNVRLDQQATQLAVYGGAVEIRTMASGTSSVVPAGMQAAFTTDEIKPPRAADIAREAWTQGTLVADDIPLRALIQELRRYRKGHLGVADTVADLTVYGNFPVHDTDRTLRMLASALPIRIEQPMSWWTSIDARR